jgi:ribonuclease D
MTITNHGYGIEFITTDQHLQQAIDHLKQCSVIAFDLEFDNNRYQYGFHLCLVQVCSDSRCFVIDPLPLSKSALKIFFDVFSDSDILKIIHAGGEDLRLLQLLGCKPKNIFDTEVAARLLGYDKFSLGNIILQKFNVELDKKLQNSNWTKRPITIEQISYAANDVVYLLELKTILETELANSPQKTWFDEEMVVLENTFFTIEQKANFTKKADQDEFSEHELFVLESLFKFREGIAKSFNKPVYQVFNDDFVREIVRNPAILDRWQHQKGILHYVKNSTFQKQIDDVYQDILDKAEAQNLSKTQTVRQRMSDDQWQHILKVREERQRAKDRIFGPIQRKIVEKYGTLLTPIILSGRVVDEIVSGETKIADLKHHYKRTVILESATELGIDLGLF